MNIPQTQTYTNFTRERFERVRATFAEKGLRFEGDTGIIERAGAQVGYDYEPSMPGVNDPAAVIGGTLKLTVIQQPMLHSFHSFCQQIKDTIDGIK